MNEQINPLQEEVEVKETKKAKKPKKQVSIQYKFHDGKLKQTLEVPNFYKGKNHKGEKVYN